MWSLRNTISTPISGSTGVVRGVSKAVAGGTTGAVVRGAIGLKNIVVPGTVATTWLVATSIAAIFSDRQRKK